MSENDLLVQQIGQLQISVTALGTELGNLKGTLGEVKSTAEATLHQALRTNGRVTAHDKDIGRIREDIGELDKGQALSNRDQTESRDRTTIRREGKWLILAALIGAIATVIVTVVLHVLGIA